MNTQVSKINPSPTAKNEQINEQQLGGQQIQEEQLPSVKAMFDNHMGKLIATRFATLILAAILTGVLFLFALPFYTAVLKNSALGFIGELFWGQFLFALPVTYIACFAVSSLYIKLWTVKRQRSMLVKDLLPEQLGVTINFTNAKLFLAHINESYASSNHPLVKRLRGGLSHFIAKKSSQDAAAYLESQSEVDAHQSHASFGNIRLIIWLLPILGFIGTVYGIGLAVSNFSGAIAAGSDVDAIKDSLGGVTSGLGTSFNTTLLALILSIAVMVPKNLVQNSEESLLVQVDVYAQERLLRRLEDLVTGRSGSANEFVDAFEKVLGHYQGTWANNCEQLSRQLGANISTEFETQFSRYREANQSMFESLNQLVTASTHKSASVSKSIAELQSKQKDQIQPLINSVESTAKTIKQQFEFVQPTLENGSAELESLSRFQSEFVASMNERFKSLDQSVSKFNRAIKPTIEMASKESPSALSDELKKYGSHVVRELRALRADMKEPGSKSNGEPENGVAPPPINGDVGQKPKRSFMNRVLNRGEQNGTMNVGVNQ